MCIFAKIKYIIVFIFFSLMVTFSAFSSDIKLEETTPMSVASARIMSGALNETGKVGIGERYTSEPSNAHLACQGAMPVRIKKSSRILTSIMESASPESPAAEIPAPLPLTIYFHSNHTNTIYQVDDFIGKPIGEYIKILVKNHTLEIKDRASYNYDFSISCNPELPKDVLTDLGIGSLTRKIVITESLSQQLSLHSCTLSFSFKEQTVLSTKCEQEKRVYCVHSQYSLIRKQERLVSESLINCFLRNARNPSSATSQSALHLGYTLVKIEGKAVITPKGSPDALLHGTNN